MRVEPASTGFVISLLENREFFTFSKKNSQFTGLNRCFAGIPYVWQLPNSHLPLPMCLIAYA